MAKRVITQLIDDITGEAIGERDGGETIKFSINDVSYSIDLNREHARAFREALAPYVDHAERLGGQRRQTISGERRSVGARTDPAQLAAIREWAKGAGFGVSDRGRIPARIREAYEDAHS